MLCSKPFTVGIEEFGCGQCLPCRINRRRLWAARLLLEKRLHSHSVFVTLTYSQENLPADQSVDIPTIQRFLKRLRRKLSYGRIRYFAVGEYGDLSGRPHYHLLLYGVSGVGHRRSSRKDPEAWRSCPCVVCSSWRLGGVHIGGVTDKSAQYTCGYLVKGWTKADRPGLRGRRPEFARMSLRPGIGHGAVAVFEKALVDRHTGEIASQGAVPGFFRLEGRAVPLGRYLKGKLAARVGSGTVVELQRHIRLSEEAFRLRGLEARAERERKREASRDQAVKRESILRSKRGYGL